MEECIFCKIVKKEISAKILYEDNEILCFEDINPVAPVHVLIIPKKHIVSVAHLQEEDIELVGKIYMVINKIAEMKNIREKGFKVVVNCGEDGGQVVGHLHYHLLGGEKIKFAV